MNWTDKEKAGGSLAILDKYMYDTNNGIKLDKVQLAEELALDIANEIKNKTLRRETGLEHEIRKIVEIIEKT